MRSTFSLTFYPKKQNVYKDGTCPVMARIRVSGSLADFSTKLKVRPALWSKAKGRVTGSTQSVVDLNAALGAIEAAITAISKDLLIRNSFITAFQIRDTYLELTRTEEDRVKEEVRQRKAAEEEAEREKAEAEERERREQGISLITFFDRYNYFRKDEVKAGQLTGKTFSRYQSARDRLITYMEEKYKTSDIISILLEMLNLIKDKIFYFHVRISLQIRSVFSSLLIVLKINME